jgi:hypothetical protein
VNVCELVDANPVFASKQAKRISSVAIGFNQVLKSGRLGA